jgi:hypothetical protein
MRLAAVNVELGRCRSPIREEDLEHRNSSHDVRAPLSRAFGVRPAHAP